MSAAQDFIPDPSWPSIVELARQLWGEPTKKGRDELRFGTKESKKVTPSKNLWHDYEAEKGGGYIELHKMARGDLPPRRNGHAANDKIPPWEDIAATYPYHDADRHLILEVARTLSGSPRFRQRQPKGNDKWKWSVADIEGHDRLLYRLPDLRASGTQTVWICEGEKDVDNLRAKRLVATTNIGGAGKWREEYASEFRGKHCIALQDNDEAGRLHVNDIARSLAGIAASVKILLLPNLPPKGDVSDWLAAGNTTAELVDLAKAAPIFTPEATNDSVSSSPVSELVTKLNAEYMVVNDAGRVVVFQHRFDTILQRKYFIRLGFDDFAKLFQNQLVRVTPKTDDAPAKYAKAGAVWLNHQDRRQYINGVVFDPTSKNVDPGALNLWSGFAVEPRQGSWERMQDHLLNIICCGKTELNEFVLNWSARLVQFPAEQGEVAIVMRGVEGCGKGVFARALKRIFGQHGLAISNPKHLTGNFNAHLRDTVFLFADECFFAGDKVHTGVLKAIVTEPSIAIEGKYLNVVECPNYLHIIMASNNEWVVPASIDSRRWFVLNVADTQVDKTAYFDQLYKELANGGYEAMLYDLKNRDITKFNPRVVPFTEGLVEQRKLSLGTAENWWLDVLHRGYVYQSKLGLEAKFTTWEDEAATELLFNSYETFARAHREFHPMSRETFGRFMVNTAKAQPRRLACKATGEHVIDVDNPYGGTVRRAAQIIGARPHGYHVGTLDNARKAFEEVTGLSFEWEKDDPDGP